MIVKQRDLYTHSVTAVLRSAGDAIGGTTIQYEVQRYVDTRNLGSANAYVVTCTERFTVPNIDPFSPTAEQVTGFINYPALITNGITLDDPDSIVADMVLIDYSPKTANTSVTTDQNQSTSSNTTNTQQYSSGSSVSQTNSFNMSASIGFFGDMLTGGFSEGLSTSQTNEQSQSRGQSRAVDTGAQYSNASSMALKDWGTYAQLATDYTMPTWIWGQEYPWNLIDFRNEDINGNIVLPQYVVDRLYDGEQIYPPSELSLLGVNFVSKVSWLVTLAEGTCNTTSLTFNHALTLCVACHQIDNSDLKASIQTYGAANTAVTSLDLPVLALDPITPDSGPALVGFVPGPFQVAPTSSGGAFQIASESNLMLVRGTGFTAVGQSDFMTTDFSAGAVSLTASFKLTDTASNVSLSLKHWIGNQTGVKLSIAVNGGAPIVKYLDAPEAGTGGDNVTSVPLRRKDFSSVDFCDLVRLGLNTVEITITSDGTSPVADYTLMAIAIG